KYQITAQSLKHSNKEQGLKAEQLLAMLVRHTNNNVPPALVKALKRWEVNGTEARVETQVVLRVSRPEVLEEMRKSRAGKFLGEILSPTAVIVRSGERLTSQSPDHDFFHLQQFSAFEPNLDILHAGLLQVIQYNLNITVRIAVRIGMLQAHAQHIQ